MWEGMTGNHNASIVLNCLSISSDVFIDSGGLGLLHIYEHLYIS